MSRSVPPEIADELLKFSKVFKVPKGFLPFRQLDHKIVLKYVVQPVCLRPYRYGALPKDVIEKLTQE